MVDEEHSMYMGLALDLARQASSRGEVPVGAVVVKDGRVIGHGSNRREQDQDPLAHAEILAISQAAHNTRLWRLDDTTIYVTMEPCPMCAGAIVNARIPRVVYGCDDPKAGAARTLYTILQDDRLNHRCEVVPGIRAQESSKMLQDFFESLRKREKK